MTNSKTNAMCSKSKLSLAVDLKSTGFKVFLPTENSHLSSAFCDQVAGIWTALAKYYFLLESKIPIRTALFIIMLRSKSGPYSGRGIPVAPLRLISQPYWLGIGLISGVFLLRRISSVTSMTGSISFHVIVRRSIWALRTSEGLTLPSLTHCW